MICPSCGCQIDNNAVVCPICGANQAPVQQPMQQPMQQPPMQQLPIQQPYMQQPPMQQPYMQQPYMQQPYMQQPPMQQNINNDASNAHTLGIVALIAAFFIPLVSWICGGIGISKANTVLSFDPYNHDAKSGKNMAIAGIIVSVVLQILYVIIYAIFWGVSAAYYF